VARESEKEEEHSRELEEKIETLTRELSGLINAAGTKGREELRDYAVSLLQGETETTVGEEPPPARETASSPFNPLALSIPFFFIGAFLLLLFPPVGIFLLAFAVLMALWGGLSVLLFKR
jgi:hypothetical protein